MANTEGSVGYDSKVYIYYNSAWLQISEPKDISGPEIAFEKAEFTHMQSPAGYREYKPTYKSSGVVSFKVNYIHTDSSHKALITLATANPPTLTYCRVRYPDLSGWESDAYIRLGMSTPMAGPNEMTINMELTGELKWQGAGSPSLSASASASASAS